VTVTNLILRIYKKAVYNHVHSRMKTLSEKFPLYAIVLSLCWWTYLGSVCQPLIVQDAVGYKQLAVDLYQNGILSYFKNGPAREPLYSLLIAFSLWLSHIFHISFLTIQLIFQIGLLFITQLLLWKILKNLNINPLIQGLALLYFGFSPAITNSALSLFSEIISFPSILLLVIVFERLMSQQDSDLKNSMRNGILLGLTFFLCLLSKGIFEIIFLAAVIFLLCLGFFNNNIKKKSFLLLILALVLSFELPLTLFKFANYKLNGHFTYTDRGAWLLYGNMARRVSDISSTKWKTALAYIPGLDFCELVLSKDQCAYWSSQVSDQIGAQKRTELTQQGIKEVDLDKSLVKLSLQAFLSKPIQATILMTIEWTKIFFYETTHIGFVVYPTWLETIYSCEFFNQSLKFLVAILNIVSLAFGINVLIRHNKDIYPRSMIMTIVFVLIVFTFFYTPFLILPRYALPIAALQIILSAFFINGLKLKNLK
jgi:hypothetical protein